MIWKKRKKRRERPEEHFVKNGKRIASSLEDHVRGVLQELGISFLCEWHVKWKNKNKFYDFFVWKEDEFGCVWSFVIEAHGDFFHARDYFFRGGSKEKLYKIQRKNVLNDKVKWKILQNLQIPILYIWESERSLSRKKILKTIEMLESGSRDMNLIGEEFYMISPPKKRTWKNSGPLDF